MRRCKGLTLIEILACLVVTSIIVSWCVTSFTALLHEQRARVISHQLFHVLHYARIEAMRRKTTVIVCGSSDSKQCDAQWQNGFIAFYQPHQSEQPETPKTILRAYHYESTGTQIKTNTPFLFQYTAAGRCLNRGTITFSTAHKLYNLIVYDSGRVRLEQKLTSHL